MEIECNETVVVKEKGEDGEVVTETTFVVAAGNRKSRSGFDYYD